MKGASFTVLLALSSLGACTCNEAPVAPPLDSASASVSADSSAAEPADSVVQAYDAKTTNPSLELRNLDGQVINAEKQVTKRPKDVDALSRLVGLLLLRARVLGSLSDLTRAHELAEQALTLAPDTASAYTLRARGRAAVHRFKDALDDLEFAEANMKPIDKIDPIRALQASIYMGVGRYDDAFTLMDKIAKREPTSQHLGDLATLLGKLGRTKEADAKFLEAQKAFRSLSPLPIVDLYFDRAMMWERAGDLDLATKLYKLAQDRFPNHVHVAVHLAQLVPPSEAIPMLKELTDRSDEPDLYAGIGVLSNLVEPHSGDASLEKAKVLYDEHYAKLPHAYADHAGWFWLNVAKDPTKALEAAKKNLEERKGWDAYELLFAAAKAAGDTPTLCAAKKEAEALKYRSSRLDADLRALEGKIGCGESGIRPAPSASTAASAAP